MSSLLSVISFSIVAVSPIEAAATSDIGVISIDVNAAADLIGGATPRLLQNGTDITDAHCAPDPQYEYAAVVCRELPFGASQVYDINVTGLPDGLRRTDACVDARVGGVAEPTPVLGRGREEIHCSVHVGLPAVLLTVNATNGDFHPDGGAMLLAPVEGVNPECIDDTINSSPATRCRRLAAGTYEVVVTETPVHAIVTEPQCFPQVGPSLGDATDVAMLSDEHWLWWCDVHVEYTARIRVSLYSGVAPEPDTVQIALTGTQGDAIDSCDSGPSPPYYWGCLLPAGYYNVTLEFPASVEIRESCGGFEVPAQPERPAVCVWRIMGPSPPDTTEPSTTTPPTTTPPTTNAEPANTLPETGGSSTAATLLTSMTFLLVGIALCAASRRRPSQRC